MNEMLKAGQSVLLESGTRCVVEQLLGSGGQGEVYRVNAGGRALALKWYYPETITNDAQQRERLEAAIRFGSPGERFLWPIELATAPGLPGFGYVMNLREERFKGVNDLMRRRVNPRFWVLANVGADLADGFMQLHSAGLCYRDISAGNVFFNPDSGAIKICDNDNVSVNGVPGSIAGTPRFMAPEVITGAAMPTTQTDLHSLAVLLFYILIIHHPLEGAKEATVRCFDTPAQRAIYGASPVFIFDPHDASNRPVKGCHDNALLFWPLYPAFIRDLFTKAFTAGLKDPDARVRESEWRDGMLRLRDSVFYCSCGAENFYDAESLKTTGGKSGTCWSCHAALRLPFRMRIGKGVVMLNHDSRLHGHHLNVQDVANRSAGIAEVVRHPSRPDVWGLKNLSTKKWLSVAPDGSAKDVEPGRCVALANGTRVEFGDGIAGEIRA